MNGSMRSAFMALAIPSIGLRELGGCHYESCRHLEEINQLDRHIHVGEFLFQSDD